MANFNSTSFNDELNRLANGGASYRTRGATVDDALAANQWAGTSGLAVVEALNVKAGNTKPSLYRDLNAVCNQLGATSGLEARDALRARAS